MVRAVDIWIEHLTRDTRVPGLVNVKSWAEFLSKYSFQIRKYQNISQFSSFREKQYFNGKNISKSLICQIFLFLVKRDVRFLSR